MLVSVVMLLGLVSAQGSATPPARAPVEAGQGIEPKDGRWAGVELRWRSAAPDCGGTQDVVVVLHGYGATAAGRERWFSRYAHLRCTALVVPRGERRVSSGGRAWWRASPTVWSPHPPEHEALPTGAQRARDRLLALLHDITRRFEVAPSRVLLVGYSQGATLAVEVAVHAPQRLGGVVVLNGRWVAEESWGLSRLASTPVWMVHGRYDHVAPFSAADRFQRRLRSHGVGVEWDVFEGGHRPQAAVLAHLDALVARALSRLPHAVPGKG